MLPLAQHQPPGLGHPLVTPWAKAQHTPTAEVYALAASASAKRVRPTPPRLTLQPTLVISGDRARERMLEAQGKAQVAAFAVPHLERQLNRIVSEGGSTEEVEAAQLELDAARAELKKAEMKRIPRRARRNAWREARKGRTAEAWRGIWAEHVARAAA